MAKRATRREFLQTTSAAGLGFFVAAGVRADEKKPAPSDQIRIAGVGIGGKGSCDTSNASRNGQMVGLCDVDTLALEKAQKGWPKAKAYTDFREMLQEMDGQIDAVTVSSTDHTHAPAALMAMRMGKHVYCQKPLTHTIYEARLMGQVAREKGVVTQMGNQGTSCDELRRAAAILRSGHLGQPKEIHVWTNRPHWPQGGPAPKPTKCPDHLKWDLWLGPVKERPYANGYHPFAWRGFWDFGTGALGDMACHDMNMPFMGLDLRDPIAVTAQTSGHQKVSFPASSKIKYEFGQRGDRGPLTMNWYDGGRLPRLYTKIWRAVVAMWKAGKEKDRMLHLAAPYWFGEERKQRGQKAFEKGNRSGNGAIIICEKGTLFTPALHSNAFALLGEIQKDSLEFLPEPEVDIVRAPGAENEDLDYRHVTEWAEAIRGKCKTVSNFPDYASPLTETVLLGNLAVWNDGKRVEWDSKNMKVTNIPGMDALIKPVYRDGYTLDI